MNKWYEFWKPTEISDKAELFSDHPDEIQEEVEALAKPKLWYPKAIQLPKLKMRTRGAYRYGYPQGAVVHYTAGRYSRGPGTEAAVAKDVIQTTVNEKKYAFFVIDRLGVVYQQFPLNEWGYHAGESQYPGLKGTVSDELVGIEVLCAGTLKKVGNKFFPWWSSKTDIPASDVRSCVGNLDNIRAGHYHKYSAAQEKSLIELLQWLKTNGAGIFETKFILGHDEVARGRKTDPGGALSMTMKSLRSLIK